MTLCKTVLKTESTYRRNHTYITKNIYDKKMAKILNINIYWKVRSD